MLSAAVVVATYSRPVIADIACRDGDAFSTCQHKFEYLTAITWEFDSPYEDGCEDKIVLKNALGYFALVSRSLDGKKGFIDFSSAPYPAGKCRIIYASRSTGIRRARVVIWVDGQRVDFESL